MKKVLLATTILALSAPLALAEVTVSGTGRMGVTYAEDHLDTDANELAFSSRIRIIFTASGETDGGLAFGGTIRADNAAGGNAGTAGNVFLSGAFGKVSMGDVAGAAEFVVGDLHGVGFTGIGDHNENIYLSNLRRPAARYEYSTGAFTFAVSADNPGLDGTNADYAGVLGGTLADWIGLTGNDNFGVGAGEVVNALTESTYAVGVRYAVDGYAVALGYESTEIFGVSADHIIVGAEASFSGVDLKAVYGKANSDVLNLEQVGISASYSMDALTLSGYHRQEKLTADGVAGSIKFRATGIGASYDLGGGAALVGGIVNRKVSNPTDSFSQNIADLGVTFTF